MNTKTFRCMICNKLKKQRGGVFILVKAGLDKGNAWKVCRSKTCKDAAKAGRITT